MKHLIAAFFIAVMAVCLPGKAVFAHRVMVFAWIEGNTVHTQSKFSGGKKVTGGIIEARDIEGNLVNKGLTDKEGEYSFSIRNRRPLRIILNAGMGHRAEWLIEEDEFDVLSSGNKNLSPPKPLQPDTPATETSPPGATVPDRQQLRDMIGSVLDEKLQPIHRMMAQQAENRISLRDILGGIGYIIGLIGLAAFIRYRKQG